MLSRLSKDTILFYEKTGLIPAIARNEMGYRVYSQEDIDTLQDHKEKLAQQMLELQNVIDIKLNKIKRKNEQEPKPDGI